MEDLRDSATYDESGEGGVVHYRRDIDGLRAVAVGAVVLCHAGVRGVPGGFVGVDIFFVISGYLITSLIVGEIGQGRFSLVTFYQRRMRRIFPALFVMLAGCAALALWLFMPDDLRAFGKSLKSVVLFVSNIYFSRRVDYFDAPLDENPLLHTWSLAVEEQFYVLFPLILIFALRYPRRVWLSLILALFLVSLALSIWQTAVREQAAFYLAQTRVWELMLGALLATAPLPKVKSQGLRESLALFGVFLIAVAVYGFTSDTPFPGWVALVPCLGAALIIYAGMGETRTLVTKVLSLTPLVFVGLISYSLYLWHWPLLVFARYWTIGGLTAWQTGAIVGASVVLAILSWAYVEQPFRRKSAPIPTKTVFAGAAVAASVSLLFAQLAVSTDGFPGRLPAEIAAITKDSETYKKGVRGSCRDRPPNEGCVWGAPVAPTLAIWGDSHAEALMPGLSVGAERHGKAISQFTKGGCRPILSWEGRDFRLRKCASQNAAALEILESSPTITTVILMARWVTVQVPKKDGMSNPEASRALFQAQLKLVIGRLLASGKTVVLVYPVPQLGFHVTKAAVRLSLSGRDPATMSWPRAAFDKEHNAIYQMLDGVGTRPGLLRIYPHKRLCDAAKCSIFVNGNALYRDKTHLSVAGANFLLPDFEPLFAGTTAFTSSVRP